MIADNLVNYYYYYFYSYHESGFLSHIYIKVNRLFTPVKGGGRGGLIFNWKERGRGHFGSLENGLFSYKPIPRS